MAGRKKKMRECRFHIVETPFEEQLKVMCMIAFGTANVDEASQRVRNNIGGKYDSLYEKE